MAEKGSIKLDNRTIWNSTDEYAGGSFQYSEWIDSTSSSKYFKLWPKVDTYNINNRANWLIIASVYSRSNLKGNDFVYTNDWYMEELDTYNEYATSNTLWGGIFRNGEESYVNWLRIWDQFLWIWGSYIDIITSMALKWFSTQKVTTPALTSNTWWTVWAWWTTGSGGAVHSSGTADLSQTLSTNGTGKYRFTVKMTGCTTGSCVVKRWAVTLWTIDSTCNKRNLYCPTSVSWSDVITFTPTSNFNGTIIYASVFEYDMTKLLPSNIALTSASDHPYLLSGGFLYIGSGYTVDIVNTSTWTVESYPLINSSYSIVSITEVWGNIVLWAWDGQNSLQSFWSGVWSEFVSETIHWTGMRITAVRSDEVKSFVTVLWPNTTSIWVSSWYTRELLSRDWYQWAIVSWPNTQYTQQRRNNFSVYNNNCMAVLDGELLVWWIGWLFRYGNKIPAMNDVWTKDITFDFNSIINSIVTYNGNIRIWYKNVSGINVAWKVNKYKYCSTWYAVTNPILRDSITSTKDIKNMVIWYKNLMSTYGNIKIYAIVDDVYFRTQYVSWVTVPPTPWAIYNVGTYHKAEVISTDITAWSWTILLKSTDITLYSPVYIGTTITKVSWTGDATITVTAFENSALITTILSAQQWYGKEFIFWNEFLDIHMPYWRKLSLIIELNSSNENVSPEIYEMSILSDITQENA